MNLIVSIIINLIFGIKKLNRIQEIDKEKAANCVSLGIKLCIIDVSKDFHLSQKIKDNRWEKVKELISMIE